MFPFEERSYWRCPPKHCKHCRNCISRLSFEREVISSDVLNIFQNKYSPVPYSWPTGCEENYWKMGVFSVLLCERQVACACLFLNICGNGRKTNLKFVVTEDVTMVLRSNAVSKKEWRRRDKLRARKANVVQLTITSQPFRIEGVLMVKSTYVGNVDFKNCNIHWLTPTGVQATII